MGTRGKPVCMYGAKCYRKNPQHFENYSHPSEVDETVLSMDAKEAAGKNVQKNKVGNSSIKKMKQTTLSFPDKRAYSPPKTQTLGGGKSKKKPSLTINTKLSVTDKHTNLPASKRKLKNLGSKGNKAKIRKQTDITEEASCTNDDGHKGRGKLVAENTTRVDADCDKIISTCDSEKNLSVNMIKVKDETSEGIIKTLFLVDMPADFYSFYDFCKSLNESLPSKALEICKLTLTGPFDVLSGEINSSANRELLLCHWRFYYDPPEFQTVLVSECGFHIGYWRDEPSENPVFLASNNADKDCTFKIEGENIFGTVFHYLSGFIKSCDPFKKANITSLQKALRDWAERNEFSLEMKTTRMMERQKKVVSRTFHGAGIVVPVHPKSEVGYRPLIETNANLKRICELIMKADDEDERESLWENLEPLITAANIANDEGDFGNSLELGIDLFCMGSPVFHKTVEHLLSTVYSLLNRMEFEKIIRAHLKMRRKGSDLSAFREV